MCGMTHTHTHTHNNLRDTTRTHYKWSRHTHQVLVHPPPFNSLIQCVAVCCSVLQYVAVCCSMLQCTPHKTATLGLVSVAIECNKKKNAPKNRALFQKGHKNIRIFCRRIFCKRALFSCPMKLGFFDKTATQEMLFD